MHLEAFRRHAKRRERNLSRTIKILSLRNHRIGSTSGGRMGMRRIKPISVNHVDFSGNVDTHSIKYVPLMYIRESGVASNRGIEENMADDRLWEYALFEGDKLWLDWIHAHIWTYVGLAAPLLGATNPLRAVISGENMGLPMADDVIRNMEICT